LSKKYPIKIDGNIIGYKDKAFPLYEKSFITIGFFIFFVLKTLSKKNLGTEAFYFLPAVIKKPEEKKEESIQELDLTKKIKTETQSQEN